MQKQLRILILEDVATDAELIEYELREANIAFVSKRVETRGNFIKELRDFTPDLILSDYRLPQFDGMSALAIVKGKHPDLPFIFVSGSFGEDLAIDTLKMGATDYVLKERLSRLVPSVQRALREAEERVERRRAEKELVTERERLAVTLLSISDGIILIDGERRIVLTNPKGQEYLKLLADVSVGDVLTCLGGQPLERLLEPPPEETTYHELILEKPFQQMFELIPQRIQEFQISGWVLIIRDITKERTIRQRVESQERLAAVGQLAAGIAHDFNNALTVIIGFSELLRKDQSTSEKTGQRLDLVIQQGYRASRLVQQILDFSRQSVPRKYPLDFLPFLKENAKLLERIIPENIRIIVELVQPQCWVLADPAQMQQVLTNLVLNARDAMPKGGELKIRLSRLHFNHNEQPPFSEMSPGDWLALSVSDTGVGIEPSHIPHIFEPFFTTKERSTGTGLGLAQVYGLVKQHNGFVDVVSELDRGTTFAIYLPSIAEKEATSPEVPKDKIMYGQGETVLLVEDEPMVLETNKIMLENLEYKVLTAQNGREALTIYRQHREEISLVITDIVMPEMDGITLLQTLIMEDSNIKAVIMTGYPLREEARKLLNRGTIDFIQKPINFTNLSQLLAHILAKKP